MLSDDLETIDLLSICSQTAGTGRQTFFHAPARIDNEIINTKDKQPIALMKLKLVPI